MGMVPEVKEAWVEALRSGDYDQGRDCLENADGEFCCLGVLADVLGLPRTETRYPLTDTGTIIYDGLVHFLPTLIVSKVGLMDQETFAELNDDFGLDFDEIADFIEEHC